MAEFSARGGDRTVQNPSDNQSSHVSHGNLPKQSTGGGGPSHGGQVVQKSMAQNQEFDRILADKDNEIKSLNETVNVLELKVQSLEKLLHLKDQKIQNLSAKIK
eukprot:CAMPEP_0116898930 /NCGR_PEP_ID=MMETSP0467-20121206/7582_1 /TAXON_ID=283647 /ORGANISM="Mesodinium pulex, Strain SPMC105" /LENGTH=103 /DNA_ID=CAMNT_0004571409 /DNA_START=358 /DNA_END=669 /DNA_ORIENTATION=-